MDELEITLGQRTVAAVHGEQTTATSYAGLGSRHVLVIGDGAFGPVPTRLAAQIAVSATIARFRSSLFPQTNEQLGEAFAEAHGAVRRAAIGSHAEGRAGASLIAVVVEATGITAARVGGGRAYILLDDAAYPLYDSRGDGFVGDESTAVEFAMWPEPLPKGARIVVLSESTARAVAADVEQLAGAPPPQLAAARVADAARRRGQYEPLAVQVVEMASEATRPGPHPAVEKLSRGGPPRTLSADGRWIGPASNMRTRSKRQQTEAGWVLFFFLSIVCGAAMALVIHDVITPDEPSDDTVAAETDVIEGDAQDVTSDIIVAVADTGPAPIILPADPIDQADPNRPIAYNPTVSNTQVYRQVPNERVLNGIFSRNTTRSAAHGLKSYIARYFKQEGASVFDDLETFVLQNNDSFTLQTLRDMRRYRKLARTQRWLDQIIPRLEAGERIER